MTFAWLPVSASLPRSDRSTSPQPSRTTTSSRLPTSVSDMAKLRFVEAVTSAVEDYAKAIYALERRGGAAVTTNALADRMGVTAASASSMVKKLDALGLVSHAPYHGV